ncbi:MAG: hypothetical protein BJ554DRAFT_205 [Olpidium bornovanus]|uniref:Uncharacterized protein n=1 Tax=Olpidium bornovanus TaxID=278681 RepID=A0A8H7ZUQ6_9FUNG|nr:MAG: hypothetical protein BJ554DRAFT_205 [Olpidium bornovanus]
MRRRLRLLSRLAKQKQNQKKTFSFDWVARSFSPCLFLDHMTFSHAVSSAASRTLPVVGVLMCGICRGTCPRAKSRLFKTIVNDTFFYTVVPLILYIPILNNLCYFIRFGFHRHRSMAELYNPLLYNL